MKWLNEPPTWRERENVIEVTTGPKTDFWRKTHYGFIRDSGHFGYLPVEGDFVAQVKVNGGYRDLYDQAGLMVRADEANWLKCGIEFVEGIQQISAVVTRDVSDWSVIPLPDNPSSLWIRIVRSGSAVEVHYSQDGEKYVMFRMAYLTPANLLNVGVMCASPEGAGFPVTFERFTIQSGGR